MFFGDAPMSEREKLIARAAREIDGQIGEDTGRVFCLISTDTARALVNILRRDEEAMREAAETVEALRQYLADEDVYEQFATIDRAIAGAAATRAKLTEALK